MHERRGTVERVSSDERLLTINETATLLRVSRGSIYRLIRNGELEPFRVCGRARFSPDDVRDYLDRSREGQGR